MGAWLMTIAGPLARQVLIALGIGVVTFTGVSAALDGLLSAARSAWTGIGSDVAQWLAVAGANHAISVLAAAAVARLSLVALKRFVVR